MPRWVRWVGGLLLLWVALGPRAGAQMRTGRQVVTYDRPGVLYISPSGQGTYARVADQSPATVEVLEGEYDLLVEGRADFFHIWHGEQAKVFIPSTSPAIAIPMRKDVAWSRVVIVGSACVALAVVLLLLRLRAVHEQRKTLEGQLEEEKAFGELRPGAIPKRIGPYEIKRRLGTGGMATVYKAVDPHGDVVALKVPDVRVLDSREACERFFREMEIGQALHHSGIIRIHEVHKGDALTHPYIALEYVDGETLRAKMDREMPMDEEDALDVVRELVAALAYAHEHDVVHRDIKPANVMLDRKGHVRIMDFGIAKATKLETMTGTDVTLGTPDYMAPEQVESRAASVQSDLYSVGVVLFEMITGRLPFVEPDAYKLLVRKMRETAPRLSELRPQVSRRLDNLVAMLLSADPHKRPSSARELLRMLDML